MKIIKFRVYGFRSVEDSGWIDIGNVSALIGTNESGKTNLLIPLWKLNPAKNGEIKPTTDYPRKRYNEIRVMDKKPTFVTAQFELAPNEIQKVVELTGAVADDAKFVEISRDFDGKYSAIFIPAGQNAGVTVASVKELLEQTASDLKKFSVDSAEAETRDMAIRVIATTQTNISGNELDVNALVEVVCSLDAIKPKRRAQGLVAARLKQLFSKLDLLDHSLQRPNPTQNAEARSYVLKAMPSFVYYSNYGNLDSEIYLPHVIENLERAGLGAKEEAKTRTLKVLFEFVKLEPQEILELGRDLQRNQGRPNEEQVAAVAEKKKERDILLQSASTELTSKFRNWWRQGEYRFRFQADGDHFRIWVSDDKRPEDIELEGRSTGLQWFFSFYLIFLVESQDSHQGSVLLLDEPGLSLHPLAQRDLSQFFENLSRTNQILYTTHSPFMVDPDHLDRVKAVYVSPEGATTVSSDLRANEKMTAQSRSIYPVYAALGLSVSDTLLQGCQIIIVEGASDQLALSAIKTYLIGHGLLSPRRDLVFIPAGGVRGITTVVGIVSGPTDSPPFVLLDDDAAGRDLAKKLCSGLYAAEKEKVIKFSRETTGSDTELEDLWPPNFLAEVANKLLRGPDEDFSDFIQPSLPFCEQVEAFAKKHAITLQEGWKVELAKNAKTKLLRDLSAIPTDGAQAIRWLELFRTFTK
ncbi:MAG: putative ATP-dependent family endonuclease [Pedosphaera sp.]|nr:putative ATP-dependent family endonuclease [Pedosphaera sp.]